MELKLVMVTLALLGATIGVGQTSPATQQQRAVKEPYQGGWSADGSTPATPATEVEDDMIMQKSIEDRPVDVGREFDELRQDRVNTLARQQGVLSEADRDRYSQQAAAIERSAPHSFEAHMAHFYAEIPSAASFQHLDRAFMRDRARQELIGPKLADALRRNHSMELTQWARKMRDQGDIAPGLYQFADDLLNSVEKDGILITAGEMDTYPILTRQFADGRRRDVLVIDQRLLVDPAYRQRIWERTRSRGPVHDSGSGFIAALAEATDRQLFLSPALGRDHIGLPAEDLYLVGLTLKHDQRPVDNMPLLEQRWAQMNKTTQAGPLSRNYLLPGIVLLKYYRAQQNEQRASAMEHELRELAAKLNATQELYRLGIFQH